MKIKSINNKLCSLILSVFLIFTSIPFTTIAQETPSKPNTNSSFSSEYTQLNNTITNNEKKDDTGPIEIIDLRTENTKHFDLGNGTYQAVSYGEAVHRKNASGEWQDIDNTLSITSVKGEKNYISKDSRVTFSNEFVNSQKVFTLSENGYSISFLPFFYQSSSKSLASVTNYPLVQSTISSNDKNTISDTIAKFNNKTFVRYESVSKNIDIEYILSGNDVKENIIVKDVCDNYQYIFYVELSGLNAILNQNGSITLFDESNDKPAYMIPPPYMYDSNGEVSHEVAYELIELKTDVYKLTIVASEEWIEASNRAFPVIIDPTLTSSTLSTYDTYFNSTDATTKATVYGYDPEMWISNVHKTTFVRSLSMPQLPSGAHITNASLKIAYYYHTGVTGGMYVTAHQVTKFWDENYSWNDMSDNGQDTSLGISPSILSTTYLGTSTTYPQWATINVTNAAKAWYNNSPSASNNNYGIALKYSSENYSIILHSSNASNGCIPYFTVTYTPKIGQGVYSISKQNTTSYARCYTIDGGAYLSQETFSVPPASEANRHAMFKIVYRPSTDDYIIRDMVNNEVVVYANVQYNAPLTLKMKNVNDSGIPPEKAWKIVATDDGFYNISCSLNGTTYYMCMPSSGTLELTTNKNLSGAKLKLHQYTGATFRGWGQIGEWPEHIENGNNATIEAYIYSTVIGENRAWFRSTSVDPDVAYATRLSYSAQMTIKPKYGGNTKIQIEANTGTAIFGYHYLISGWDNGCFFMQNKYANDCLTTLGGNSEAQLRLTTMPNGSNNQYTVWRMKYGGNGYYWIVQDKTGESIYDDGALLSNIHTSPSTGVGYQQNLWKFIPQSDGSVKIQNYYNIANNIDKYLSLGSVITKNIRSLSGTNNKQLWIVQPLILYTNVIYDQGFVDRYGSSYLDVLESIYSDNSIGISFSSVLKERFGIRLHVNFSSSTFESYPYTNNCIHKNQIDTYCLDCKNAASDSTETECTNGLHHKAETKFLEQIPNTELLSNTNRIDILYTGHRGCYYNDEKHIEQYANGWAPVGGSKIVIMAGLFDVPLKNGDINSILGTVVHESLHCFGAEHCDGSESCIMIIQESTVTANLKMCRTCINVVNANKHKLYNMSFSN